jgi:ATP-dependent Clp protease ATP-binding subunit ClpB
MDFNKFTEKSRSLVQSAQNDALAMNHQKFLPEHLLMSALDEESGIANRLISSLGSDINSVKSDVKDLLNKQPKISGSGAGQMYMDPDTAKVLKKAEDLARSNGDSFVTVERILQAIAAINTPASKV